MTNSDLTLLRNRLDEWLDIVNYWEDEVRDVAERFDDQYPMYVKYSKMIEEMYNLMKDCEKFLKECPDE